MDKGMKGRSPAINSIGQRPMNETRAAAIAPSGLYSDCALAGLRFLFAPFRRAAPRAIDDRALPFTATRIPTGMHRSVKNAATRAQQHPVKDASLSGCGVTRGAFLSTERYSLTGMTQSALTIKN